MGSEENPAEGETEIGKQEGTGGMDIKSGKVTSLSRSYTSSVPIKFKESMFFLFFFLNPSSNVTFIFSPDST